MPYPTDLAVQHLVTLPSASISALRAALLRTTGEAYATCLQEAGYAGGDTIYMAFRDWLATRGADAPDSLPFEAFALQAGAFFADTGWGNIQIASVGEVAAMIQSNDWAEADPDAALAHPGCHFTAGLFADFLGRVANSSLAVLEVECRSCGAPSCRFVAGSAAVLEHVYERMANGTDYVSALGELT